MRFFAAISPLNGRRSRVRKAAARPVFCLFPRSLHRFFTVLRCRYRRVCAVFPISRRQNAGVFLFFSCPHRFAGARRRDRSPRPGRADLRLPRSVARWSAGFGRARIAKRLAFFCTVKRKARPPGSIAPLISCLRARCPLPLSEAAGAGICAAPPASDDPQAAASRSGSSAALPPSKWEPPPGSLPRII